MLAFEEDVDIIAIAKKESLIHIEIAIRNFGLKISLPKNKMYKSYSFKKVEVN